MDHPKTPKTLRVALFGSFYRGYYTLCALRELQSRLKGLEIVGVATDDPSKPYVSPTKRVWQYPHTSAEEVMVQKLADDMGLHAYTGKVKTKEFYETFENSWQPDICYMTTFGQLIDKRIFAKPKLGFYNLHPSTDKKWPSYAGGNPFQAMIDNKEPYIVITLHKVNEKFDEGALINVSERIDLPETASVIDLHKITALPSAQLVRQNLLQAYQARFGADEIS